MSKLSVGYFESPGAVAESPQFTALTAALELYGAALVLPDADLAFRSKIDVLVADAGDLSVPQTERVLDVANGLGMQTLLLFEIKSGQEAVPITELAHPLAITARSLLNVKSRRYHVAPNGLPVRFKEFVAEFIGDFLEQKVAAVPRKTTAPPQRFYVPPLRRGSRLR